MFTFGGGEKRAEQAPIKENKEEKVPGFNRTKVVLKYY